MKFYSFLANSVVGFFNFHLKNEAKSFTIYKNMSLIDTLLYYDGVEPPLREDQLISIIRNQGIKEGFRQYNRMKVTDTNYVPFDAFELTKVAFSFVRDSSRTDEAVEIMKMVLTEYPHLASSYALKGRIHEIRGELADALKYFKTALEMKPAKTTGEELVFYEDPGMVQRKN